MAPALPSSIHLPGVVPFGRYAFASDCGTSVKEADTIGLAQG